MTSTRFPGPDLPSETTVKAHSETGAVCPQHGTPVQRSTIQTLGVALSFDSGCHSCEREAAEKERREEQRGFEHAQAVAAIPARYRTASLASFPALAPGQDFVLHHAHAFIETSGSGSTGLILLGSLGTGKHTSPAPSSTPFSGEAYPVGT